MHKRVVFDPWLMWDTKCVTVLSDMEIVPPFFTFLCRIKYSSAVCWQKTERMIWFNVSIPVDLCHLFLFVTSFVWHRFCPKTSEIYQIYSGYLLITVAAEIFCTCTLWKVVRINKKCVRIGLITAHEIHSAEKNAH